MHSLVLNSLRFKIDGMSLVSNVNEILSKLSKEQTLTVHHEADKIKSLVRKNPVLKILTSEILLKSS